MTKAVNGTWGGGRELTWTIARKRQRERGLQWGSEQRINATYNRVSRGIFKKYRFPGRHNGKLLEAWGQRSCDLVSLCSGANVRCGAAGAAAVVLCRDPRGKEAAEETEPDSE